MTYDAYGRPESIAEGTGPDARTTWLGYDPEQGWLSEVTNSLDQTVSYDRDAVGRVETLLRPDLEELGFSYDLNGNLEAVTPPSVMSGLGGLSTPPLFSRRSNCLPRGFEPQEKRSLTNFELLSRGLKPRERTDPRSGSGEGVSRQQRRSSGACPSYRCQVTAASGYNPTKGAHDVA